MHKITSNFTCKQNEDGSLEIEGYASTDDIDRDGDVIPGTVWTEEALKFYRKNPIVLYQHDYREPIGMVTDISVKESGLMVVAKISKAAGRAYDLIYEGLLKAFSIGFQN